MQEKGVSQYCYEVIVQGANTRIYCHKRNTTNELTKKVILQFYERYNGFCCFAKRNVIPLVSWSPNTKFWLHVCSISLNLVVIDNSAPNIHLKVTGYLTMVARKCYRCKSKTHLSGQCSLPKRTALIIRKRTSWFFAWLFII